MCNYCDENKLNTFIESDKIWNMIYFYIGRVLDKTGIEDVDNSVVLEIRNKKGYLRLGDRGDMQCLDHDEKIEIHFCPMCGRKLGEV